MRDSPKAEANKLGHNALDGSRVPYVGWRAFNAGMCLSFLKASLSFSQLVC